MHISGLYSFLSRRLASKHWRYWYLRYVHKFNEYQNLFYIICCPILVILRGQSCAIGAVQFTSSITPCLQLIIPRTRLPRILREGFSIIADMFLASPRFGRALFNIKVLPLFNIKVLPLFLLLSGDSHGGSPRFYPYRRRKRRRKWDVIFMISMLSCRARFF